MPYLDNIVRRGETHHRLKQAELTKAYQDPKERRRVLATAEETIALRRITKDEIGGVVDSLNALAAKVEDLIFFKRQADDAINLCHAFRRDAEKLLAELAEKTKMPQD